MPRKALWPPPIYPNRGFDYLRLKIGPKRYKDYLLGVSGSEESQREYRRLLAELESNGRRPLPEAFASAHIALGATVSEMVVPYLALAKDRHTTRQFQRIGVAMRSLVDLYGLEPASEFTPARLEVVRAKFVEAGYCRNIVNSLTSIVRQLFRWAVVRGYVKLDVASALELLPDLRKRQTVAPDHPPVKPVHPALVQATLPHLPQIVADLVRVQLYSGMRPGEAVLLRPADIDRNWREFGGVRIWLYTMDAHKTDWKGRAKQVPLGPLAQAALAPYLDRDPQSYCYSPYEVRLDWCRRYRRKPHFGASRYPGKHYTTQSYGHCIRTVCDRVLLPCWSPNQLRHAAATLIESELGREDARCVLGHDTPTTTAVYAESVERAARAVAKLG